MLTFRFDPIIKKYTVKIVKFYIRFESANKRLKKIEKETSLL